MIAAPVCFVDTETTGLDPDRHEIWEVALILPDGVELVRQLPVDLGRADPMALKVGRFRERRARITDSLTSFAREFARLTDGLHLCGAVVSFDAERLAKLLRANGECPSWHYHLIDVEALAAGCLARSALALYERSGGDAKLVARAESMRKLARPPWDSDDLSRALGVEPDDFDRHTALGDARWAKAIYEEVMGS